MTTKKIIILVLIVAAVGAQFFQPEYSSPEVDEAIAMEVSDLEVKAILDKACMDCHSNETKYPWYSSITPVNFWIAGHIEHGREELNFSEWNSYPIEDQKHLAKEAAEIVEKKEMPMLFYWLIHWDAKLTDEERATLVAYFNSI